MELIIEKQQRSLMLDSLRGIAILLVLGRHILFIPENINPISYTIFSFWQKIGWMGVDLFFVLSGFLVSGLLFKEHIQTGKMRLGRFLIRRGFRIFPPFYLLLLVAILIQFNSPYTIQKLLGEIFFLQNYLGAFLGHTWSLAVEVHFYLILACLLGLMWKVKKDSKDPFKTLPTILASLCIIILIFRTIYTYSNNLHWLNVTPLTHFQIDAMLFGVLLSYFSNYYKQQTSNFVSNHNTAILITSVVLISPVFFISLDQSQIIYTLGLTPLYIGHGLLILTLLNLEHSSLIHKTKPVIVLSFLGRHSYSIYLWHWMIYFFTRLPFENTMDIGLNFYKQTSLYLSCSILMGVLMSKAIEKPSLLIRDRYFA